MDATTAIVTALGLAGAAGLNAYIPLLVVGLLGRLDVIALPSPYDQLASTPVLAVLAVLLAVEFFADKIPAVDTVNDGVQTFVRPFAGALLAAGSIGVLSNLPPWVGVVAGILTAGSVHAAKSTARPAINVSTAGLGAPVVSSVEDAISLVASLLAVLAPVLLVLFVLLLGLVLVRWWSGVRARRTGSGAGHASAPE